MSKEQRTILERAIAEAPIDVLRCAAVDLLRRDAAQAEEIARLKKELESMTKVAFVDQLTGLRNRSGIKAEFSGLLKSGLRCGKPAYLAVFLLDIDFFKSVNDTHGHTNGDAVLRHVSETLKGKSRGNDYYFRWGGEELGVLVSVFGEEGLEKKVKDGTREEETARLKALNKFLRETQQDLSDFAQRLGKTIAAAPYVDETGKEIAVTVSIGIALEKIHEGLTLESLIERADGPLYAAKRYGRNRAAVDCADFESPKGPSGYFVRKNCDHRARPQVG